MFTTSSVNTVLIPPASVSAGGSRSKRSRSYHSAAAASSRGLAPSAPEFLADSDRVRARPGADQTKPPERVAQVAAISSPAALSHGEQPKSCKGLCTDFPERHGPLPTNPMELLQTQRLWGFAQRMDIDTTRLERRIIIRTEPEEQPARTVRRLGTAYWASRCLHIIAGLGIADRLGDEPQMAEALAYAVNVKPRPLHRNLRSLTNHCIFVYDGERFAHSEASRKLRTARRTS